MKGILKQPNSSLKGAQQQTAHLRGTASALGNRNENNERQLHSEARSRSQYLDSAQEDWRIRSSFQLRGGEKGTLNSTTSCFSQALDRNVQLVTLERQNELLRIEKDDLQNQLQRLKIHYTRQSALDQQELANFQREKATLADKMVEETVNSFKEKFEKQIEYEKLESKQRRLEQEDKLERVVQGYKQQITMKDEEILKIKNKSQFHEINQETLSSKLLLLESTTQEQLLKKDQEIRNLRAELEVANRKIHDLQINNDQLDRQNKILGLDLEQLTKKNSEIQLEESRLEREIDSLKQQKLNLSQAMKDLEYSHKIELESAKQSEIALSKIQDLVKLRAPELEAVRAQVEEKEMLIQARTKDISRLELKLSSLEKNIAEKDSLVHQMASHIESIESLNFSLLQQQKQAEIVFSKEIEALTNEQSRVKLHNIELSGRLNEQQNYFNAKIEAIFLQFTHFSNALLNAAPTTVLSYEIEALSLEIRSAKNEVQILKGPDAVGVTAAAAASSAVSPSKLLSSEQALRYKNTELQLPINLDDRFLKSHLKSGSVKKLILDQSPLLSLFENNLLHEVSHFDTKEIMDETMKEDIRNLKYLIELKMIQMNKQKDDKDHLAMLLGSDLKGMNTNVISIDVPHFDPRSSSISSGGQYDDKKIIVENSKEMIEVDLSAILALGDRQQLRILSEENATFDLMVGFIGNSQCGKSTIIQSIQQESYDRRAPNSTSTGRLQVRRYECMNRNVGLVECGYITSTSIQEFMFNLSQVIVIFFESWENHDFELFNQYLDLLHSDMNSVTECIVIHQNSKRIGEKEFMSITENLAKMQEGIYRGVLEIKLKKVNVYHIFLHNHHESNSTDFIFDETIAVCKGTIIGKLTSLPERTNFFDKLNANITLK